MTRQCNESTVSSSVSECFLHSINCKRDELFPFCCGYFGRSRCCHGVPCLWIHFPCYAKGPSGVRRPLGTPHTRTHDLFPKQRCVGGRLFINCVIELHPLALFVGMSKTKTAFEVKYLDFIVHASEFLDYQIIDIPAQNICRIWTKKQWFRIFIPHSMPSFPICPSDVFLFLLTSDVFYFNP